MFLTRQQARDVDRFAINTLGFHPLVLMENAGRGAADWLMAQQPQGVVQIVCGKGNNGGDGLVVARHLLLRGQPCQVWLAEPPVTLSPDARTNWVLLERAQVPWVHLPELDDRTWATACEQSEWIVDALLGTGATGDPRSPYAEWIARINASGKRVLALDVPSGLDCDTGAPSTPTIRATATVTFVAPKVGFARDEARERIGELHVCDIGVPLNWLPRGD